MKFPSWSKGSLPHPSSGPWLKTLICPPWTCIAPFESIPSPLHKTLIIPPYIAIYISLSTGGWGPGPGPGPGSGPSVGSGWGPGPGSSPPFPNAPLIPSSEAFKYILA